MKVTEQVAAFAEPIVKERGCELWDVEYVREGSEYFLRLYLDKEGGVDINDCEAVSRAVDPILDEKDPIPDKYFLEVSSPGIDRPLKKDKDFKAAYGTKVDIMFFAPWEGLKSLVGVLEAHDDEAVWVRKIIKGKEFKNPDRIERKLIAVIRPHIDL